MVVVGLRLIDAGNKTKFNYIDRVTLFKPGRQLLVLQNKKGSRNEQIITE